MTEPSPEQVEAAVRSVLAGLACDARRSAQQAPGITYRGKLFACRQAESLPAGTLEVRVEIGTVVTPLAFDHLKRQGIVLRIVAADEANRARSEGEWGFAIDDNSGLAEAVRRSLLAGPDLWVDLGSSAVPAARWVLETRSRGALVLTSEASLATWSVNQLDGIRAATVVDTDSAARAVQFLGANLLVVEPRGKSISWLKQVFVTFRRLALGSPPSFLPERHEDHANRRGDRKGDIVEKSRQPQECPVRLGPAHDSRGLDGGFYHAW
jgi:hypothetical protein